ncbi:MAG TPA: universal stress protein [Gemmatimonadaceae bacterium]|nr:universal stress protein [Gemmatimonadaceae bacterium]
MVAPGPILIATRGDPSSAAAVRVGGMFAARQHRHLEIVAVVPPVIAPAPGYGAVGASAQMVSDAACDTIGARVRAQVSAAVPTIPAAITVEIGAPADGIVDHAEVIAASMIVLGVGRHAAIDRVLGLETAISVMRLAHVPVLAVAADAQVRMTAIAIATDFGASTSRAAHLVTELAMDDACVHLLHVAPSSDAALSTELAVFGETLPVPKWGTLRPHLLTGDRAHALIEFCDATGVELIALGSHGRRSLGEMVLRHARGSVLFVP